MARRIPSMSAILAFEAAARHGNFSVAANELCLTPGAISKQIQKLEEDLVVCLFERHPKGVSLTKIGLDYFNTLNQSLSIIENKTSQIRNFDKNDNEIVINIAPSFCNWLITRLEDFQKKFPQFKLTIISKGCGNLESANADISIFASKKKPQDQQSHFLYTEKLRLICHPKLKINKIADLTKHKFLEHQSRDGVLEGFTKEIGLDKKDLNINSKIEHFSIIVNMVKNNLGIGLVPEVILGEELQNKNIINPLNIVYQSQYSYYLTYQKYQYHSLKISKFRQYFLNVM
jgi:DNA-binding transcriptional LysR family regulator